MSDDLHPDIARIVKVCQDKLSDTVEDLEDGEDIRVDTFMVCAVVMKRNAEGEEEEWVEVWSESRRQYVQLGIMELAQQALQEDDLSMLLGDDDE